MGSVNLDNTGSGSAITLSSDGTSLLLDGTAIGGGGGADLYAESYDGTSGLPVATGSTNAVAVGRSYASGTDSFAVAIGNNTSSYGSQDTNSISMGSNAKSTGWNCFAQGYGSIATGGSAVAMGFSAEAADGIAFGYRGKATAMRSFGVHNSGGGATGNFSTAIGDGCLSSGAVSVSIGIGAQATGNYSWATGARTHTNGLTGKHVWSGIALSGNNDGSTQTGKMVLAIATTDATATAITSTGTAASNINQVVLPNNSAYAFHGTIVARQKASEGTASAAWKVEGLIRREGSAGTTVLVASTVTALSNTPSWGMALTADTTNGGLKIEATGAAATNIRWVATINTSEVTYA